MPIFLAHQATIEDVIAEYGSPDLSIEGLAAPRLTGAFERRDDAVRKGKEAAIDSLRQFVSGKQTFEQAYGDGRWTDGQMTEPPRGRPRSVHKYRKGDRIVAIVVVEYVAVE